MPDRIQRNRVTGEYRIQTADGDWHSYTPPVQPEMYHPGLDESPSQAYSAELLRTGKDVGIGLLRSPWDALKGLLGLPAQVVKGLMGSEGLPALIADPSLLTEIPTAARAAISALGANPREAGSLIGQLLLGRAAPAIAPKVPGALTTVGSAAERAGTTLAESKIGGWGVPGAGIAEAIFQGDPKGLAVAATPYALKYGGRGVKNLGQSLEGLKRAATPEAPSAMEQAAAETVNRATTRPVTLHEEGGQPPTQSSTNLADLSTYPEYEPALPKGLPEPSPEPATLDWLRQHVPEFTSEGEAGINPPGPRIELFNRSSPDVQIPEVVAPGEGTTLPASWQPFTENPVTQSLRAVLEELRQRATPGLTNPTGR